MMSIYKKVLGNDFDRLHPMLQKRYDLDVGSTFEATGIMKEIKGGPKWLYPLFPARCQLEAAVPGTG